MVREHRTYGDTPTIGKHHLRGHSTSEDTPSMGEYAGIPHRLWRSTTYGDIPIPFKTSHLSGHSTYRDILALGTSCLRGHSTSGDISSMGTHHLWGNTTPPMGIHHLWGNTREYHTAYGEVPPMGTSPYLLKLQNLLGHPTFGDILPLGTSCLRGHSTFGLYHLRGHTIYEGIPHHGWGHPHTF